MFSNKTDPIGMDSHLSERTTASRLLNESGRWNPDAIERSLAHADKDSIRGIYNRGFYREEHVAMHQWWSANLDKLRATRPMTSIVARA